MQPSTVITVAAVLKEMETGKPFDLTYITFDRKRKTGGELRTEHAVLNMATADDKEGEADQGHRAPTAQEANLQALSSPTKNPNHQKWYTRLIIPVVDGHVSSQLRKVHPPLFAEFNGMTVVP